MIEIEISTECPKCRDEATSVFDKKTPLECPKCRNALCLVGFQMLEMD